MAEGTTISENNAVTSPIAANPARERKMAELSYMKLHGGNILFSIFLREKNRFESAISRLEHRYGKSNVKTYVRNSRWDGFSILKNAISKGYNLSYDIRSMMANDSVNSILKFSVVEVGKIIRDSRDDLDEVILAINEKQNGVIDRQDEVFDNRCELFGGKNELFA